MDRWDMHACEAHDFILYLLEGSSKSIWKYNRWTKTDIDLSGIKDESGNSN